ncbi:MAG: SRPBCC family protein [Verrucomicrobiales bacterium]|nr:SRPBCC family protein [Verrucomicrobiales bacterium]
MNGSTLPLVFVTLLSAGGIFADEDLFSRLPEEAKKGLREGNAVVLERRPDETAEIDKRFVTMAKLLTGTRSLIWEVIHDKEDAEKFLDGVLESKVLEKGENEILVAQKTHVGGPKGAYRYTLRHKLEPMKRADFSFVEGEIKNVLGSWWIYEAPDPEVMLVVYSLHIDPGVFAPQFVVKRGMRKTIPATLASIQKEVTRRQKERASVGG